MHREAHIESGYTITDVPDEIIPPNPYTEKKDLPYYNKMRAERGIEPLTWEKILADEKGRRICISSDKKHVNKQNNFLTLAKHYISERERLGRNLDTYILSTIGSLNDLREDQIAVLEVRTWLPKSKSDLEQDWQQIDDMKKGGEYRKADLHHYAKCNVDGVCGVYPFYQEVHVPPKYIQQITKYSKKE